MKTRNRLREHAALLAGLAVLGTYVWTGIVGLLVIGSGSCVLDALWMWSHRRIRMKTDYINAIVTLALSAYTPKDRCHAERVAALAEMIAQEMRLPKRKVALIRTAGYLHDIGRYIRNEYTSDCWHVAKGADLVSRLPVLCETADWIRHHHTWHDGVSCLASLAHQTVPIEAAILAVAEYLDSLIHDGAESLALDEAIEDVRRRIGTQFHPAVAKVLPATLMRMPPVQQPYDSNNLCPSSGNTTISPTPVCHAR